jgi:hypothetical protein
MAKADVRIVNIPTDSVPVKVWQTEANATDILAGEPVKLKAAGSPYVIPLADNEPVIGTTTQVIGIAASNSTHTASVDGTIRVYIPVPGTVFGCKATTSTNFDTQSEIDALVGDRVLFDFGSSTYTVDENAGDTATSGLQIVGGDPDNKEVYFVIRPAATEGPVA